MVQQCLLSKAKDAKVFFDEYPKEKDGNFFALSALETLNNVIPDLEKLLVD